MLHLEKNEIKGIMGVAKLWDRSLKRLFRAAPRDFAEWLLPGCHFIRIVSPVLPLTKGGARREVVEDVITGLLPQEKELRNELLTLAYGLASLAFGQRNKVEQQWLRRRFAVFNDILRETPIYQEVLEEGLEKGIEKGREEALQQARQEKLHEQRQALLNVIMERFPKIVRLVRKQVEAIEDPAILWHLIVKMSTVQTAEEAKQLLFNVAGNEEEN